MTSDHVNLRFLSVSIKMSKARQSILTRDINYKCRPDGACGSKRGEKLEVNRIFSSRFPVFIFIFTGFPCTDSQEAGQK